MKQIKNILLLLTLASSIMFAQSVEMLFEQGNSNYQNEEWESAIDSYSRILNQGYESEALYFNLGNAYFKIGNLGEAILNYERALKLEPGDEDIQFNLKLANARTVDNIKEVPKLFLLEWWDIIVTAFSVSGWALIVLLIYLALLIFIGTFFMSGSISLQRLGIYGGILSVVFLILFASVFIASYEREASSDYGVIITSIVNVKASPTEESSDAFVVHEGLKFEIQDQVNKWTKIKLADGKIGWLPQETFEKI